MLTIPPSIVAAMQDHALACYPGECCGLLFAKAGSDQACRCVPLDNLADKLHAMDPVEYPRTSRDWFAPNEAKLARHVREAEAQGERWLGLFHSHIDCGAYFSDEDRRYAAPDGQAVYPALVATHPDFARTRT
jgi:proteasome lid subunit RPN8/RPN11